MYYPIKDYEFIIFIKSNNPKNKYDAIIQSKNTLRYMIIPFGDSSYGQYKDTTGLYLYSSIDNLDNDKRKAYRERHQGYLKMGYYNPEYFSYFYLW